MKHPILAILLSVNVLFGFDHLTEDTFGETALKDNVILKFYAPWCTTCKRVESNLKSIDLTALDVKVYKINVEEQTNIAQNYTVQAIPTLIYLKDGKILQVTKGFKDTNDLKKDINTFF